MKKKVIVFALVALMLVVGSSVVATAAETTGQTTMSGAFWRPGLPDPPQDEEPETPSYSYEINIPALYDTMTEEYMEITAQNISIGSGKRVAVYLDAEKTLGDDNLFELFHTEYPQYTAKGYLIRASSPDFGIREQINSTDTTLVATFLDGSDMPDEYGYIIAVINADAGAVRGVYNGTIYFKIAVEDL